MSFDHGQKRICGGDQEVGHTMQRTIEYDAKMSLTKEAILVGRSKFCAVTELMDSRGWDQLGSGDEEQRVPETAKSANEAIGLKSGGGIWRWWNMAVVEGKNVPAH